jgi:hypothetical protein
MLARVCARVRACSCVLVRARACSCVLVRVRFGFVLVLQLIPWLASVVFWLCCVCCVHGDPAQTPLFAAASGGHAGCARLLVNARADVDPKVDSSVGGLTPLMIAADSGFAHVCGVLVGAEVGDVFGAATRQRRPARCPSGHLQSARLHLYHCHYQRGYHHRRHHGYHTCGMHAPFGALGSRTMGTGATCTDFPLLPQIFPLLLLAKRTSSAHSGRTVSVSPSRKQHCEI